MTVLRASALNGRERLFFRLNLLSEFFNAFKNSRNLGCEHDESNDQATHVD